MDNCYQKLGYDYEPNLKLIFLNEVSSPVFTKEKIVGRSSDLNGVEPIKVILVDSNTDQKITIGREASAKLKIVLLRGDYNGSTNEEFEKSIIINWGNKKNLLLGNLLIDLKHGCASVGEIRIKHDRNPIKNVTFRLGVIAVNCSYKIKEGVTNPFEVKDRRNVPKYLGPVSPENEVWSLKNISKKGKIRKRLESKNIRTVKNFLDMHSLDPGALQEICCIKGKKWVETVNHANTSLDEDVSTGSTYHESNTLPSHDYDSSIKFDHTNCYKPQPIENDLFSTTMIVDYSFSTQDVEICEAYFHGLEPCQAYEEGGANGASALVGVMTETNGVKAKKRWMKFRRFWFSITFWSSVAFLTKKIGSCVVQTG